LAEQVDPRLIIARQLRERAAKLDATEFMPAWRDLMEEAFPEIDAWYAENPIVVPGKPKMPWLDEGLSADLLRYIQMARDNPDSLRGALAQSIADTMMDRERAQREKEYQFYKKLRHNGLGGPVRVGP
jgi:hypothetical protein